MTWFCLISKPFMVLASSGAGIRNYRQFMFNANEITKSSNGSCGIPEVSELLSAIKCGRVPVNVVVDVMLVCVSTDNKGMASFQKSFGELIANLICFLSCHLSRAKRLSYLVCNYLVAFFSSGQQFVLPFGQKKLCDCRLIITSICRNQRPVFSLVWIQTIVNSITQTISQCCALCNMQWYYSCCCYRVHLLISKY